MIAAVSDSSRQLGEDTRQNCWLCDRKHGELCHVHERLADDDAEPAPVVVPLSGVEATE